MVGMNKFYFILMSLLVQNGSNIDLAQQFPFIFLILALDLQAISDKSPKPLKYFVSVVCDGMLKLFEDRKFGKGF